MASKKNTFKVTMINGVYFGNVETSKGYRYQASYATQPTPQEVQEDFNNPKTKKNFKIVK